jgi:hypothetical protein
VNVNPPSANASPRSTLTFPQTTVHRDLHLALLVQNANGAVDYTGTDFVNDLLKLVNENIALLVQIFLPDALTFFVCGTLLAIT